MDEEEGKQSKCKHCGAELAGKSTGKTGESRASKGRPVMPTGFVDHFLAYCDLNSGPEKAEERRERWGVIELPGGGIYYPPECWAEALTRWRELTREPNSGAEVIPDLVKPGKRSTKPKPEPIPEELKSEASGGVGGLERGRDRWAETWRGAAGRSGGEGEGAAGSAGGSRRRSAEVWWEEVLDPGDTLTGRGREKLEEEP